MTLTEAIDLAADWWVSMFRSGTWDNGDVYTTTVMVKAFRIRAHQPTEADYALLKQCVTELLTELSGNRDRFGLYCDYGNPMLDDKFFKYGLKLNSLLHGPCKAGTFLHMGNDGWEVLAKEGYGATGQKLEPRRSAP